MDKIYLIFGIVIILIIYFLYQKSENFNVEGKVEQCIQKCGKDSNSNKTKDDAHKCIKECVNRP